MHCFDRPASAHEFRGQIVQQFGMRRRLALNAEIIGAADDSFAKVMMPEAIDHYPRQKRVRRIDHTFGEFEPAAALGRGDLVRSGDRLKELARRFGPEILVAAANKDAFIETSA